MAFSRGELEYLHSIGKVPDWAYYQQNGNGALWNYLRQKEEIRKRFIEKQYSKQLEKDIEDQIGISLEKVLNKLLVDFQK